MLPKFMKPIRVILYLAAALFFLQVAVAVMGLPPRLVTWMTAREEGLAEAPRTIVVLGGGGIPSESGLIRTYYGAVAGTEYRRARIVVSLPTDENPDTSSVGRMRDELVMRGVPRGDILMEYRALNTHYQAEAIGKLLGAQAMDEPLLLVTSPSHARRSVLCFRKAGFNQVGCMAADDTTAEADPGRGAAVRYGFWRTLEMELRYAREFTALCYYRVRGWI